MKPLRAVAFLALLLAGCAHPPAPTAIRLPTTAAVRAPIVAARASNARAVQLAAKASKHGIAAGSADARALTLATAATDSQLARALAQIDTLTKQLLDAADQIAAVERYRAAETARADALAKKLAATHEALSKADSQVGHLHRVIFCMIVAGVLFISLVGRELEELLRKVEAAAFNEVLAAGHAVEGVALKIPAVLKFVARFSWLLAFI